MKRLIAVGLILAVLAVGLTALADPIVVGGSDFTTSSFVAGHPGNAYGNPVHLGGIHVIGKPIGDVVLLSSPIVVGGS
jgi:hypothetical protein